MNAEVFAEWLRRQGHRVIRTDSSYWFDAGLRAYQAFPYHWLIEPSDGELRSLLRQSGAAAIRYSAGLEYPQGKVSYHVVWEGQAYSLELLDRRVRQNVRTGLNHCRVEPISLERLAEEGWALEADTVERQGRRANLNKDKWRRRCLAAVNLPGFEAWGAVVGDRLAASILTFRMDDCCEMIFQQCDREFLNARVNNALAFTVTQVMINRPGVRSIFYALHSLDAPPTVDEFKFRMGYTAKPVRQRVVFHPWIELFANRAVHRVLVRLCRWKEGKHSLAKAEGMLRFYLQGRRSLLCQEWPECLERRKRDLSQSQRLHGQEEAPTSLATGPRLSHGRS